MPQEPPRSPPGARSRESSIRNWLSRRREYSRSGLENGAGETESGVGSLDGVFTKCEGCKEPIYEKELRNRYNVCPHCEFHYPLGAPERIRLLTDANSFEERDAGMVSGDPLEFEDYEQKLVKAGKKSGLDDAVIGGVGKVGGRPVALASMDFRFIGGSMGSVVGERVARTVETATEDGLPLVIVSASGGARMFEGIYALMQMAKTSVTLSKYAEGSQPYISILTDPTFGGVTASFATAADIILAEPGARIGFAGARVIEQTTKERLPEGFQTAEFQREHGMVDRIVHRLSLKNDLERLLGFVS
jgi:acetyl-CoA carboxylase carboxyl transferase subunit beta